MTIGGSMKHLERAVVVMVHRAIVRPLRLREFVIRLNGWMTR